MPRFAANLTMLYPELGFLDRLEAAARDGFEAVECQFPYAYAPQEIAARLQALGLRMVLHNLPAGDWAAGERGIAVLPQRAAEFRAGVALGIETARALGCPQLNCLAGIRPADLPEAEAHATFVANLRYAARALQTAGLRLLVEPINTFDIPGFFACGTRQTLDCIGEVGEDNVFLQFDVYHMHRMEGAVAATIGHNLPAIAHIQIADHPGRHEPGTGEIPYAALFAHLDRIGYTGWVGCEYLPAGETRAGLAWRKALLGR